MTLSPARKAAMREYFRSYHERPDVAAKRRAYWRLPEVKTRAKLRRAGLHPEVVAAEIRTLFPGAPVRRRGRPPIGAAG